jgi:cell fate (sporulation/competence/biofilm development) regulator YlbF (YheA/YmcA/DUF963 family)
MVSEHLVAQAKICVEAQKRLNEAKKQFEAVREEYELMMKFYKVAWEILDFETLQGKADRREASERVREADRKLIPSEQVRSNLADAEYTLKSVISELERVIADEGSYPENHDPHFHVKPNAPKLPSWGPEEKKRDDM